MKKTLRITAAVIIFTLIFGIVSVSAAKKEVIDNDLFYVELPDGFTQVKDYTPNYYFENENITCLEFYVEGNFQFPDGIKETDEDVISKRAEKIIRSNRMYVRVEEIFKTTLNGFNVAFISGIDYDLFEEPFSAYVFATKETVFIIYCQGSSDNPTTVLEKVAKSFTINGTYFDGDEPTIDHNFQGAEDYYSSHEEDIEEYYTLELEQDGGIGAFVAVIFILAFLCPAFIILFVIFIVLYVKNKKKLKEYKRLAGNAEMFNNGSQMYGAGMYGAPYDQVYIPQQPPFGIPMGYAPPVWQGAPNIQPTNEQNESADPVNEITTENNENKEI